MPEFAIKATNLTKKFSEFVAVDHINFEIKSGDIFGFLGPNGAGKSTTIKMLCTLLNPTFGSALVNGYDIVKQRDDVRNSISIVFQDSCIDRKLTGRENLDFHARMYHMSKKERDQRISEVLDLLDLKGKENTIVNNCSWGVRRRFEVARGFMTHPKILFLDEPTLGMDIETRMDLWEYIQKLNKLGTTIIITTHYIEEADYLCGRVAIIDHSKIIALDTPKNLKTMTGGDTIVLELENGEIEDFSKKISGFDEIKSVKQHNSYVELKVKNTEEAILAIVEFADGNNFKILSIDMHKQNLEDAFLYYVGRTIRETEAGAMDGMRQIMARIGRRR